jgi:hypothetical protein
MIKMRNIILANSTAANAMPLNPRIPAMMAIIKNVNTQLSIIPPCD